MSKDSAKKFLTGIVECHSPTVSGSSGAITLNDEETPEVLNFYDAVRHVFQAFERSPSHNGDFVRRMAETSNHGNRQHGIQLLAEASALPMSELGSLLQESDSDTSLSIIHILTHAPDILDTWNAAEERAEASRQASATKVPENSTDSLGITDLFARAITATYEQIRKSGTATVHDLNERIAQELNARFGDDAEVDEDNPVEEEFEPTLYGINVNEETREVSDEGDHEEFRSLAGANEDYTPEEVDYEFTVVYTKDNGEPLTAEEVESIFNHPISRALDLLGQVNLIRVDEGDSENEKIGVFSLTRADIPVANLEAHVLGYQGTHTFPRIGTVTAVGVFPEGAYDEETEDEDEGFIAYWGWDNTPTNQSDDDAQEDREAEEIRTLQREGRIRFYGNNDCVTENWRFTVVYDDFVVAIPRQRGATGLSYFLWNDRIIPFDAHEEGVNTVINRVLRD